MSDQSDLLLQALIESRAFTPEEVRAMQEIKDRSPQRVSYKDTCAVAKLVHKKLRGP